MEIRLSAADLQYLPVNLLHGLSRTRAFLILGLVVLSPVVYWLASPLFINVTVHESLPIAISPASSTITSGTFIDADSFHQTSGVATILRGEDGSRFVRLSNFQTTNGPDLFVVLSKDLAATDVVYVGALKGNIGDQNYALPSSVDLTRYPYLLIWCRTFSVLFGSAELS